MVKNNINGNLEKRVITITLSILFILFFINTINSATYSPPWIDENQTYRVGFNITGASSDTTNMTLQLYIDQTIMGSNFNFSLHRNSTRFYYYENSSGTYQNLSHHIINWDTTNNNATIQFKAPILKTTPNDIYFIYFGDLNKPRNEDYCNTYIYCDLFEDGVINSLLTTGDYDTVSGTAFSESGGVLSITAGGADTWTGSDEYSSVFLNDISGDLDIKLKVVSQTNPNGWSKSGIMIRNDMTQPTTSTGYVFNVRTPDNGYAFQRDENDNGYLDANSATDSSVSPSYLRLIKNGTIFTAYYSKTTINSWTSINSRTMSSANTNQDIGISLTSHAGSTLGTSEYDNFTVQRYSQDTFTITKDIEETLANYMNATFTNPTTITSHNIIINNTINITTYINCTSYGSSSCGNLTIYLQYNSSPSAYSNIADSDTTPLWIMDTNQRNCILNDGENCNVTWTLNTTGNIYTKYNLRTYISSNITNIENTTTDNLRIMIVNYTSVKFNMTPYNFGNTTINLKSNISKNLLITSDNGDNTNIILSCTSGNCNKFDDTWTDGTNLNNGNSNNFNLICIRNETGNFNAIFEVTSDEFGSSNTLSVSCSVNPKYGPINITTLLPTQNPYKALKNDTFELRANISCEGKCSNVTAYPRYILDNWWNHSFAYRQIINITSTTNSQQNYQVFINLSSTNIGNSFDWSNNCNDIRFTDENKNLLDYWIQNCSTSTQDLEVWVETDDNITSSGYTIYMYYGNSYVPSMSNISNTFRNDEIFMIGGDCPNGNANCNFMDNHAEADYIRANIGSGSFSEHGRAYVTQINDPTNPFGPNDNFYLRYRFLFAPKDTASYSFGIATDDGSDVGTFPSDGYGGGIRTNHPFGAHDVISDWYGGHATGTCGSSGANEGTRTFTAGNGYWIDFTMQEATGGQDSELCIAEGAGSYLNVDITNFPGEIFAREYITPEPSISSITNEENLKLSGTDGDTPFWINNSVTQSCIMPDNGYCIFSWIINASGPLDSNWTIDIQALSNISIINTTDSDNIYINITNSTIPEIIAYTPNNTKIIGNKSVNLTWYVKDDDPTPNCMIYINEILNTTITCNSSINNTYKLPIKKGKYNWSVSVNDSDGNIVNSSILSFTYIDNYHIKISKTLSNTNTDLYNNNIEIKNINNITRKIEILDFVHYTLNYGSFNPLYNWTNISNSLQHNGTVIGWNISNIENYNNYTITYSLTKNTNRYHLSNNYMIGLS